MTIGVTGSRFSYTGDGVTTTFPFPRLFLDPTDLRVIKRTKAGVETLLTYTIDYSVTGAKDINGGSITLNVAPVGPPNGEAIVIWRETQRHQDVDLENGGQFSATTIEDSFDKLYLITDELNEKLSRAAIYGMGALDPLTQNLPLPVAGKVLGWNDGSTALINRDPQYWRYGAGDPAGSTGSVSDFYLNTVNGDVWSKIGPTTWTKITTIQGSQGPQGATGPTGPAGNPWGVSVSTGTFGSTANITYSNGLWQVMNLTANVTSFNITGWPAAPVGARIVLEIRNTGNFDILSWPAGTKWPGSAIPALTQGAGAKDLIILSTSDAGATILGTPVAFNFS